MIDFLAKQNAKQPINLLRKHVPGHWFYDFRAREWRHESGLVIVACAQHAPKYDGDDDTYRTVYRRQDTMQLIDIVSGRGLVEDKP